MTYLYQCPHCHSDHSGIASAWEDGGGEYGDDLTPIFDCFECGGSFTGEDGMIGYLSDENLDTDRDE